MTIRLHADVDALFTLTQDLTITPRALTEQENKFLENCFSSSLLAMYSWPQIAKAERKRRDALYLTELERQHHAAQAAAGREAQPVDFQPLDVHNTIFDSLRLRARAFLQCLRPEPTPSEFALQIDCMKKWPCIMDNAPLKDYLEFIKLNLSEAASFYKIFQICYLWAEGMAGPAIVAEDRTLTPEAEITAIQNERRQLLQSAINDARIAYLDDENGYRPFPGTDYSCWPGLQERLEDMIGTFLETIARKNLSETSPFYALLVRYASLVRDPWIRIGLLQEEKIIVQHSPNALLLAVLLQTCAEQQGYHWITEKPERILVLLPGILGSVALQQYKRQAVEKKIIAITQWLEQGEPRNHEAFALVNAMNLLDPDSEKPTLLKDWKAQLESHETTWIQGLLQLFHEMSIQQIQENAAWAERYHHLAFCFREIDNPEPQNRLVGLRDDWQTLWDHPKRFLQKIHEVSGLHPRHLAILIGSVGGLAALRSHFEAVLARKDQRSGTSHHPQIPLWDTAQLKIRDLQEQMRILQNDMVQHFRIEMAAIQNNPHPENLIHNLSALFDSHLQLDLVQPERSLLDDTRVPIDDALQFIMLSKALHPALIDDCFEGRIAFEIKINLVFHAIDASALTLVELALQEGPDGFPAVNPNQTSIEDNTSILGIVAGLGDAITTRLLLQYEADPHFRLMNGSNYDHCVLKMAILNNHAPVVQVLLQETQLNLPELEESTNCEHLYTACTNQLAGKNYTLINLLYMAGSKIHASYYPWIRSKPFYSDDVLKKIFYGQLHRIQSFTKIKEQFGHWILYHLLCALSRVHGSENLHSKLLLPWEILQDFIMECVHHPEKLAKTSGAAVIQGLESDFSIGMSNQCLWSAFGYDDVGHDIKSGSKCVEKNLSALQLKLLEKEPELLLSLFQDHIWPWAVCTRSFLQLDATGVGILDIIEIDSAPTDPSDDPLNAQLDDSSSEQWHLQIHPQHAAAILQITKDISEPPVDLSGELCRQLIRIYLQSLMGMQKTQRDDDVRAYHAIVKNCLEGIVPTEDQWQRALPNLFNIAISTRNAILLMVVFQTLHQDKKPADIFSLRLSQRASLRLENFSDLLIFEILFKNGYDVCKPIDLTIPLSFQPIDWPLAAPIYYYSLHRKAFDETQTRNMVLLFGLESMYQFVRWIYERKEHLFTPTGTRWVDWQPAFFIKYVFIRLLRTPLPPSYNTFLTIHRLKEDFSDSTPIILDIVYDHFSDLLESDESPMEALFDDMVDSPKQLEIKQYFPRQEDLKFIFFELVSDFTKGEKYSRKIIQLFATQFDVEQIITLCRSVWSCRKGSKPFRQKMSVLLRFFFLAHFDKQFLDKLYQTFGYSQVYRLIRSFELVRLPAERQAVFFDFLEQFVTSSETYFYSRTPPGSPSPERSPSPESMNRLWIQNIFTTSRNDWGVPNNESALSEEDELSERTHYFDDEKGLAHSPEGPTYFKMCTERQLSNSDVRKLRLAGSVFSKHPDFLVRSKRLLIFVVEKIMERLREAPENGSRKILSLIHRAFYEETEYHARVDIAEERLACLLTFLLCPGPYTSYSQMVLIFKAVEKQFGVDKILSWVTRLDKDNTDFYLRTLRSSHGERDALYEKFVVATMQYFSERFGTACFAEGNTLTHTYCDRFFTKMSAPPPDRLFNENLMLAQLTQHPFFYTEDHNSDVYFREANRPFYSIFLLLAWLFNTANIRQLPPNGTAVTALIGHSNTVILYCWHHILSPSFERDLFLVYLKLRFYQTGLCFPNHAYWESSVQHVRLHASHTLHLSTEEFGRLHTTLVQIVHEASWESKFIDVLSTTIITLAQWEIIKALPPTGMMMLLCKRLAEAYTKQLSWSKENDPPYFFKLDNHCAIQLHFIDTLGLATNAEFLLTEEQIYRPVQIKRLQLEEESTQNQLQLDNTPRLSLQKRAELIERNLEIHKKNLSLQGVLDGLIVTWSQWIIQVANGSRISTFRFNRSTTTVLTASEASTHPATTNAFREIERILRSVDRETLAAHHDKKLLLGKKVLLSVAAIPLFFISIPLGIAAVHKPKVRERLHGLFFATQSEHVVDEAQTVAKTWLFRARPLGR